jgi:hypothetical protein
MSRYAIFPSIFPAIATALFPLRTSLLRRFRARLPTSSALSRYLDAFSLAAGPPVRGMESEVLLERHSTSTRRSYSNGYASPARRFPCIALRRSSSSAIRISSRTSRVTISRLPMHRGNADFSHSSHSPDTSRFPACHTPSRLLQAFRFPLVACGPSRIHGIRSSNSKMRLQAYRLVYTIFWSACSTNTYCMRTIS